MKEMIEAFLRDYATARTMREKYGLIDSIANKIINADPMVVSIDRTKICCGTWKYYVSADANVVGSELSKELKKCAIIAHDKNEAFTLSEFRLDIRVALYELAEKIIK